MAEVRRGGDRQHLADRLDPEGREAVRDSFDHCSAALQNLTDATVSEMIEMGGQKVPRVYFMFVLVADWADHYSTQAGYLRLNDILPPSARRPAGR